MVDEIALLLQKIKDSEDLIERAEAFYKDHQAEWSDGVALHFERFLERKREQIYFEQSLVEKLGWQRALERNPPEMDI